MCKQICLMYSHSHSFSVFSIPSCPLLLLLCICHSLSPQYGSPRSIFNLQALFVTHILHYPFLHSQIHPKSTSSVTYQFINSSTTNWYKPQPLDYQGCSSVPEDMYILLPVFLQWPYHIAFLATTAISFVLLARHQRQSAIKSSPCIFLISKIIWTYSKLGNFLFLHDFNSHLIRNHYKFILRQSMERVPWTE